MREEHTEQWHSNKQTLNHACFFLYVILRSSAWMLHDYNIWRFNAWQTWMFEIFRIKTYRDTYTVHYLHMLIVWKKPFWYGATDPSSSLRPDQLVELRMERITITNFCAVNTIFKYSIRTYCTCTDCTFNPTLNIITRMFSKNKKTIF